MNRLVVLLLAASSAIWAQTDRPADSSPTTQQVRLIFPDDLLNIQVLNQPGLSGLYRVNPDGVIVMPLARAIKSQGLTAQQLEESIRTRLQTLLNEPVVFVRLVRTGGR
jgi:protein involved in polysaccharide export with SLBB domain